MIRTSSVEADISVDLLVVGSGCGGLVAALTSVAAGRKVLVIEKLPVLGGSTALSGGAIWIPNNSLLHEAGEKDAFEASWQYLHGLVGADSSTARKNAFLVEGPNMVDFLREQKLQFIHCKDWADYYAARPGGHAGGRAIESVPFDGKQLGADFQRLNRRTIFPSLPLLGRELSGLSNGLRTRDALRTTLGVAWRTLSGLLTGRPKLTMGMALVAQLIFALKRHGVEVLSDTPLLQLLTDESGGVTGAVIRRDYVQQIVHARDGVVLAAGGFSRNAQMRSIYQPQQTTTWTTSSRGDEGDAIQAGLEVGAGVGQMDESWWMPTSILPDGKLVMCIYERSKPYSIIVDSSGERFVNECTSYMEVGQIILRRQATRGGSIPCWFILDARHRRYYPFGEWMAGSTPRIAFDSRYMIRGQTLEELAQQCGINVEGLLKTVERYNKMCADGIDEDFHRGEDPYDRYFGDSRVEPNPTMGPIEQAPFYAVALYPGDIGTNGGLLTDENARVLRGDGTPISGLYATGNATASVMGRVYPGPGATIGPSMVFGFVGARHASRQDKVRQSR